MQRLTEDREYLNCDFKEDGIAPYFNMLREYENLALTPEQIKEMDKLYLEKCKEVTTLQKRIEHIVEILDEAAIQEDALVYEGDVEIDGYIRVNGAIEILEMQ